MQTFTSNTTQEVKHCQVNGLSLSLPCYVKPLIAILVCTSCTFLAYTWATTADIVASFIVFLLLCWLVWFVFLLDTTVHSYCDLAVVFFVVLYNGRYIHPIPFAFSGSFSLVLLTGLARVGCLWPSPSMQVPSVVLHNKQLSVVLQFHTQSFLTVIPARATSACYSFFGHLDTACCFG